MFLFLRANFLILYCPKSSNEGYFLYPFPPLPFLYPSPPILPAVCAPRSSQEVISLHKVSFLLSQNVLHLACESCQTTYFIPCNMGDWTTFSQAISTQTTASGTSSWDNYNWTIYAFFLGNLRSW